MNNIEVNPGDIYGRFTIIEELDKVKGSRVMKCECVCGKIKNIRLYTLRTGRSKSCGCLKKELAGTYCVTHGSTNDKLYGVWKGIKSRCMNPNFKGYKNYGGRGISINWISFEDFYKDMGKDYKEGLTIERLNNDGNYCKENCIWSTRKEQSRNKRNNIIYKGECLKDWCIKLSLNYMTVYTRINRGGKSIKEALQLIN